MDEPRLPDSRRGLFLYWKDPYPGRGLLAARSQERSAPQKQTGLRLPGARAARAGIFFMDMPETL